jgi:predicted enzyme related to lactoylglutathione lyase
MPNAFVHIELNTDDVPKAKKFYKSLFAWTFPPMGEEYTGIDVGKGVGGGMSKKPMAQAPTMWLPYVEVDDVKKTIAKARKLGAEVHIDYTEVGEMGAIGVFNDPFGATIGVWEKREKPAARKKPASKSAAAPRKKPAAKKRK